MDVRPGDRIGARIAPQQTHYHHSVRPTVPAIARAERRITTSLTNFARWAGITL